MNTMVKEPPPIPDEIPVGKKPDIHPKARAAFICGVAGVFAMPVAVVAIILGHIAKGELKENPELGGKNYAIAGLVLGYFIAAIMLVSGVWASVVLFWPEGHKASEEMSALFTFTPVKTEISDDIHAVVFDGGKFIATLEYGKVMTSGDGLTWEIAQTDSSQTFNDLVVGNGKVLAVQDDRLFVYDGVLWKEEKKRLPEEVSKMIFNGRDFVGSVQGGVLVSTDGVEWTRREIPGCTVVPIVSGDRDQILAEYSYRLKRYKIGNVWELVKTFHGTEFETWKGCLFAASSADTGIHLWSKDEKKWKRVLTPAGAGWFPCTDFIERAGPYLTAFGGHFSWSEDGTNWGSVELDYGYSGYMKDVAYGNGRFVLAGSNGKIVIGLPAKDTGSIE